MSDIVNGIGFIYAWINGLVVYPLLLILFTHFVLVFPRPQPWLARRRWVIPLLYLLPVVVVTLATTLGRPMSMSAAGWVEWAERLGAVTSALALVYTLFILIAAVASFVTARDPVSRAQIRWVIAAFIFAGVFGLLTDTVPRAVLGEPLVSGNVTSVVSLLMPIAIAIAILRYGLFNIDIIIRRTTQYAIVTGLLVLVYFGSVIVLQGVFTAVTGQTSTLAIVLSTLLIAALFLPLRRRVQEIVDRRFFRKKYDAQKTMEAFAATVRDETDLDALTAELVRVIEETMQPEHVTVWLAPDSGDDQELKNR